MMERERSIDATRTKRKPAKVKTQRRWGLLCLCLLALCLYFIYTAVAIRVKITRQRQELIAIESAVYDQQLLNEEIERIIYNDGEKEYIERIAREKLGYAAIDERIFVDLSGG